MDDEKVALVDGVFDGAFSALGNESWCFGEGVLVSSLVRSMNNCLGGMMVSFGLLKGLEVEALVDAMENGLEVVRVGVSVSISKLCSCFLGTTLLEITITKNSQSITGKANDAENSHSCVAKKVLCALVRFPILETEFEIVTYMLQLYMYPLPSLQKFKASPLKDKVKLLIVDSMAALISGEYEQAAEKKHLLGWRISFIKSLAEDLRIPIVMTNQVRAQSANQMSHYSFQESRTGSVEDCRQSDSHLLAALGIY
ncbi:DNA repair protein RAD51 homolog 2 isoform X1 [Tanacetum coccineum]